MDLIGSVKYIESRLGERKSYHNKGKPARKSAGTGAAGDEEGRADAGHSPAGNASRLGRKIDTTA